MIRVLLLGLLVSTAALAQTPLITAESYVKTGLTAGEKKSLAFAEHLAPGLFHGYVRADLRAFDGAQVALTMPSGEVVVFTGKRSTPDRNARPAIAVELDGTAHYIDQSNDWSWYGTSRGGLTILSVSGDGKSIAGTLRAFPSYYQLWGSQDGRILLAERRRRGVSPERHPSGNDTVESAVEMVEVVPQPLSESCIKAKDHRAAVAQEASLVLQQREIVGEKDTPAMREANLLMVTKLGRAQHQFELECKPQRKPSKP